MKVMMISKRNGQVVKSGFVSSKAGMRKAIDSRDNKYGAYLNHVLICPVTGREVNRFEFNWS